MLPLPFPSIAGILVLRLCDSLFQPFQTEIQNEMLQTPYRATALSLNAMLTNGVAIGTNLAYGALAQYSLSLAFCFGAALCATGLGLYLARQIVTAQGGYMRALRRKAGGAEFSIFLPCGL